MTLNEAEILLNKAKSAKELFGDNQNKTYRQLMLAVHPDRNIDRNIGEQERATRLLQIINHMWESLKAPPQPPIKSPKRVYQPISIIGIGDAADLHYAKSDDKEYILKISRGPGSEVLLKNEAANVAKLLASADGASYRHYFPTLVESFPAKDKVQKHINVFTHEDGFFDLEKAKATGLDPKHVTWVFKRLLTAIGFAHQVGIVHGAVLPRHIRIYPGLLGQKDDKAHALMLVGWGHSVGTGEVVKTISARYRDWYPPEILNKKPVSAATDIYMAAKCMVYLAGANVLSKQVNRFISSLIIEGQKMRPDNAWDLLDEFVDLLRATKAK